MVERDNEPPSPGATGGLSADEADRLAERFRPSWERDDAVSSGARRAAKQTLIGIAPLTSAPAPPSAPPPSAPPPSAPAPSSVAPVSPRTNSISSAAASPNSSLPPGVLAEATARAPRLEGQLEKPVARERPIGKQTLIGLAPIPSAPRKAAADDLPAPAVPGGSSLPAPASSAGHSPPTVKSQADLPPPPPIPPELSARPPASESRQAPATAVDRGTAAVAVESTKPPPSEPPRGIVTPYQPKDDPSGPAVVLKDDVLAMEEAQAATEELLREHAVSSRRAPTVMNLKAPPASAYPAPDFPTKRSKAPLFVIGGLAIALVGVLAVSFGSGSKAESSPVSAAPVTATSPATAPPEPALEVPPPLPPEPLPEAPSTRETEAAARTAPAKPTTKRAAPRAPAKASPKPASGTTTPSPKKGGVIVRDTPF